MRKRSGDTTLFNVLVLLQAFLDDSETWGLFSSTAEVSGFLDSKLPD